MSDESTAVRWLVTVGGALAGLVGLGVSLGTHRQRILDHERRLSELETDAHKAAEASQANGLAIIRLEVMMQSVQGTLDRIEKKLP